MDYRYLTIKQWHQLLVAKKVSVEKVAKTLIQEFKKADQPNFLITLPEKEILAQAKLIDKNFQKQNWLAGVPYLVKDNFATKGIRTTAGSKILDNFIPPYNATIIDLLDKNQGLMMGKVALDELGMGGTGLLSAYGKLHNPHDKKRLIGGSSSGSAYAVSRGYVPYATGTDTGDSIRKPASFAGVVGFKPTYGALSRSGIIPYAPSLDHAGFLTNNVEDMAILMDATAQKDDADLTSQEIKEKDFFKNLNQLPKTIKFGYLKVVQDNFGEPLKSEYQAFYDNLKKAGYDVQELNFDQALLEAVPPAYMMISFPEAVSSHANLTGVNFGLRAKGSNYVEIMTNTRSKYLGPIVKRRFLIGSLNLKKDNQSTYFLKAKRVRRLIVESLAELYKKVDILILPPTMDVAPLIEEAEEYDTDHDESKEFLNGLLTLANFNGMPSITIPFVKHQGLPIGINLNANVKKDLLVLQAAKTCETMLQNQIAE